MNPFAEDIDAAKLAIKEDGCEAIWWKTPDDNPNSKPWREDEVDGTPFSVDVALFSPKELGYGAGAFGTSVEGSEVPQGMEIAMFAGGNKFEPELTDWLELPTGNAEVVRLDRLAPNDIAILWFAWIKR